MQCKYDSNFIVMQIFGIGFADDKAVDLQLQFKPSNVFYEHTRYNVVNKLSNVK
jgi:hypothetical protein